MLLNKVIVILGLLVCIHLYADTPIAGGDVSGHWTIEESPYIVNGVIIVPPDSILVIDPGVHVKFTGPYYLKTKGILKAEGTVNDTIIFDSEPDIAWYGLRFYNESDNIQQDSSSVNYVRICNSDLEYGRGISLYNYHNIILNHVNIKNTYYGIKIMNTAMVNFRNISITNSEEDAIYCEGSDFILDGSYLSNNSNGIVIFSGLNDIKIMNTQIVLSRQYGLSPPRNPDINVLIVDSQISNCDIGINILQGSLRIDNCVISNNIVGIGSLLGEFLEVNRSIIHNNYRGLHICETEAIISNSNIHHNNLQEHEALHYIADGGLEYGGAGILISNGTGWEENPIILINTLITDNISEWGAGISIVKGKVQISNCTISNNVNTDGNYGSGLVDLAEIELMVTNSIIHGNDPQDYLGLGWGVRSFSYSNFGQEIEGIEIINEDPMFIETENNNYHLNPNSLCVDAGNPDELFNDFEDPNNLGFALYPALGIVRNDMGAYGGSGYYETDWTDNVASDTMVKDGFNLSNYPNPFNPETNISYNITLAGYVELSIYNTKGQKVNTLVKNYKNTGTHTIVWDGKDSNQEQVSSGIYFYRIKTNEIISKTKKMILIK